MQNNFKMDNELYHFGIKGQRWGVRRYQNPDGSLTALGKKKYGTKSNFEKVQAAKKAASGSKIKAQLDREKANARTQAEIEKYRKKAAKKLGKGEDSEDKNDDSGGEKNEKKKTEKQMSNEELRTATERINLERNYAEAQKNYIMTNQQLAQLQPQKISKGKEFAKKIWKDAVEPAVVNAGKKYLDNMLKDALGLDKNPMAALEKKAKEAELKKKIYESESAKTKAEQQAYNFERNKQANLKSEKENNKKENFENAKKQVEDYYNNVYLKDSNTKSSTYRKTEKDLTDPVTRTKPITDPKFMITDKKFIDNHKTDINNGRDYVNNLLRIETKSNNLLLLEDKKMKHSETGGESMNQNELYHFGIKGQRWGVRRYQNPDGSLTAAGKKRASKVLEKSNKKLDPKKVEKRFNKNSGVMSKMVKPLINITQMANERTDYGKMLDKAASYNKNNIDKLNFYRDYQVASKKNMESIKGKLQRIEDNDLDPASAFTMKIFGKENAKKILSMDYESSKAISQHSEKRVNELLNTFKDVPIKEVESYRYVTIGNTTASWNGTKYVIDKR